MLALAKPYAGADRHGTLLAGLDAMDRTLPRLYRRFPRLWYQLEPDLATRLGRFGRVRPVAQPVPQPVAIWPKREGIDHRVR